jgi:CRP-like cAMP-binding protein
MKFEQYASLAFFSGLALQDLETLAPYFSCMNYVAGTTIFQQGDPAKDLFIVGTGEVSIRYKPDDGPVMTVTRVQSGGVFGWSAAMGNARYTSGAVCSLDSEILTIRGDELRILNQQHPRIGKILLDRLSLVIADRQQKQQEQVSSFLASGIRQENGSGGSRNG